MLSALLPADAALLLVHYDSPLLSSLSHVTETKPSPLYMPTEIHSLPSREHDFRHWDWVITDDVVPTLGDVVFPGKQPSELDFFIQACEIIGDNVIHFIPDGDNRSLEEWSEFAPHHYWADDLTFKERI